MDLIWNPKVIAEVYQIFRIECCAKRYWIGMKSAVDKIFDGDRVLSVCYFGDYGESERNQKCMYILLERSDNNDDLLRRLVDSLGDDYRYEEVDDIADFIEYNQRVMVQLFINALQSEADYDYSLNNLSGKYYCVDIKWVKKNSFRALEFIVENARGIEGLVLSMHVRNFNRMRTLKLRGKEYNDAMSLPQYTIGGLVPKRVFVRDDNNFIMKQHKNTKDTLAFIDTDSHDAFKKTKMGYFYDLVKIFNAKYSPESGSRMCRMEFRTLTETDSRKFNSKTLHEFDCWLEDRMSGQVFCIIDMVNDDTSAVLLEDLKSVLDSYGAQVAVSNIPLFDSFNICIIHNEEYYDKGEMPDPYDRFREYGVQHIVVDDYDHEDSADLKLRLMVMVKELVIKRDIIGSGNSITVDDWSAYGFKGEYTFIRVEVFGKNSSKRSFLYRMTVRPDGSFDIDGREVTSDFNNEYYKLWSKCAQEIGGIEGMVIDSGGNVNVIRKSNIITIPEASIGDELKVRKIRNKYGKEHIFKGQLDLRMLKHGDDLLYYSGFPSYSVWKMKTVPNVRVVESVKGNLFFSDLIELMNVPFVRYRMMTVMPYPFKYLEEYRKILSIEPRDDACSKRNDEGD